MPPQHGFRGRISFLTVDAPVSKLFERNGDPSHAAAHERTRADNAKIAVEISDLSLPGHGGGTIGAIEQTDVSLCASVRGEASPRNAPFLRAKT